SNGLLIEQKDNGDGTRTDFWRQELPHAPYLCMIAVGVYAKTTDYWQRGNGDSIEVSYYVDPEYGPYARAIFGNTPEMISCFSDKLGYKYPWDKFSQVVVRDFVSGAMENTTCVVHGEFLQRTTRELLDNTNEDVISHELFHHWFGDLVTCESWSNLPLNESFATYGEYIWRECKYGRESADQSLKKDLDTYLMESRQKQVDMIRFDYDDREDMFDSHSYAKGGCILHMLRKYVGDDAFFNSLKLFLHRHAFQPVEIHQLRLAFEEVTGEDLNWFFNQWFFASGHPELHISYRYVDSTKQAIVSIEQLQDAEKTPIYKLPMVVDIYTHNKVARDTICLEKQKQDFVFRVEGKPDLINVDAEKMLLCRKTDDKALTSFVFQYYHAPLYLDRYEAIKMCSKSPASDTLAAKVLLDALRDPNDKLRLLAIRKVNSLSDAYPDFTKAALSELAHNDEKASVRAASIRKLSELFTFDAGLLPLFRQALKDSSYTVIGVALAAIVKQDKAAGMSAANSMEKETAQGIILAVSRIYADFGTDRESAFFTKAAAHLRGFYQFEFIMNYQRFLKRSTSAQVIDEGITCLTEMMDDGGAGYVKYFIRQALSDIKHELEKRHYKLEDKIEKAQKDGQISEEPFKNELAAIERQINSIEEALKKNGDQQFNVRVITTEED
ncbi:MAG: M1 family metallopeptidase, partial [Flavobacteriales bacterium]